jgi:hypothetical protein
MSRLTLSKGQFVSFRSFGREVILGDSPNHASLIVLSVLLLYSLVQRRFPGIRDATLNLMATPLRDN